MQYLCRTTRRERLGFWKKGLRRRLLIGGAMGGIAGEDAWTVADATPVSGP
jgi:hypothetical protein